MVTSVETVHSNGKWAIQEQFNVSVKFHFFVSFLSFFLFCHRFTNSKYFRELNNRYKDYLKLFLWCQPYFYEQYVQVKYTSSTENAFSSSDMHVMEKVVEVLHLAAFSLVCHDWDLWTAPKSENMFSNLSLVRSLSLSLSCCPNKDLNITNVL